MARCSLTCCAWPLEAMYSIVDIAAAANLEKEVIADIYNTCINEYK